MLLIVLFFVACAIVTADRNLSFVPCSLPIPKVEHRRLFVITCETRLDDLFFLAWNMTGVRLRSDGVFMQNICENKPWDGFLTKPVAYLKHVEQILSVFSNNTMNYVMIMDSDTFWSISKAQDLWHRYDCARGSKDMLVSSEMTCWIGIFCHITQFRKYYGIPGVYPSYSPFVNSGVIMGQINLVHDMLRYTLARNATYFQEHRDGSYFHDQYAVTDYAKKVAPNVVAVDYHQQLIGSYFVSGVDTQSSVSSACYDRNGSLSNYCQSQTPLLYEKGHFVFDNLTCEAYRKVWPGMPWQLEVESLATRPAIWHGNGRGKGMFQNMAKKMLKCFAGTDKVKLDILHETLRWHREGGRKRNTPSPTASPVKKPSDSKKVKKDDKKSSKQENEKKGKSKDDKKPKEQEKEDKRRSSKESSDKKPADSKDKKGKVDDVVAAAGESKAGIPKYDGNQIIEKLREYQIQYD